MGPENLNTNGIILSAGEKRLYVANGPTLAAFDRGKDGSLTNQREFAKLEGVATATAAPSTPPDACIATTNSGAQVISADGKYLGLIPTPRGVISVAFSGPDRRTLYAVSGRRRII